nr:hypothetical protein [uncultured Sphingomonas sp.]
MPRYFLHLRDGSDDLLDPDGKVVDDLEALRSYVLMNARDCIAGDLKNGVIDLRYRIDAEDEAGSLVYSLPFKHAFSIIPANE